MAGLSQPGDETIESSPPMTPCKAKCVVQGVFNFRDSSTSILFNAIPFSEKLYARFRGFSFRFAILQPSSAQEHTLPQEQIGEKGREGKMIIHKETGAKEYLVVAHYDGDRSIVCDLIRARAERGPAHFVVLVPATPPRDGALAWSEEQAHRLAEERLDAAVRELAGMGAEVSGEIGADSVGDALADALLSEQFDEVILATPAPTLKERLLGDGWSAAKHRCAIPITHIVIPSARAA